MELFLYGVGATLAVIMLLLTLLTRGKIWIFVWFFVLYGLAKLAGKNPLG
jgi:prolipoprotein diacylglyceryltransferase